jgi:hypothetical protein
VSWVILGFLPGFFMCNSAIYRPAFFALAVSASATNSRDSPRSDQGRSIRPAAMASVAHVCLPSNKVSAFPAGRPVASAE